MGTNAAPPGDEFSDHNYGKPTDGFTRLTTSLETVSGDLGTTETPVDRFFVCSASEPPTLSTDTWRLTIDGDAVQRPVTMDFAQLDELPRQTITAWLECAGNGRSMFTLVDGREIPAENAHTGWMLGGMGLARWEGPRLRDVLAEAGVTDRAAFVSPVGLDVDNTEGEPARMCLPLDKARDDATIVATHMNGQPLVPAHGAPVRLVVPGWVGAYSVKWLGGLTVSSSWVPSWRSDVYYVHRTPEDEITGPVTAHPVKSSLAIPYPAAIGPGWQELVGYARSGSGPITAVDWSIDGGPWRSAELDEPAGPYAWTVFRFEVDLEPGEHIIRSRATDNSGATQPEQQPFHPYGVLWQSVIPHPVTVRA
ncbi:MAG: molybdopterin-dependent oxidoreductase [Actinomycetota bacterium]